MSKRLHLSQSAEFKLLSPDDSGMLNDMPHHAESSVIYIEGYASVFLNADGSRLIDRDMESVNTNFLDVKSYTKNPVLVYNHEWDIVIGKIIELRKDAKGLYVKAEVHKITGYEHIFEGVQKNLITSFSIGFVPHELTYLEDEDIIEISKAELVEISLAPVQANQDALFRVTGQKSLAISSKKDLLEQNDMTCDELSGMCSVKTIKGTEMTKTETATKEVSQEAKSEEAKPAATEAPAVQEPKKEEPRQEITAATIAEAVMEAQRVAQAEKERRDAEAAAAAEAAAKVELEAKENARQSALQYIKQRKEEIEATAPEELDTDSIEEFYELVSDAAAAIESKVLQVIESQQSA